MDADVYNYWSNRLCLRGNPITDDEFTVVCVLESGEVVEATVTKEGLLPNGFGDWVGLQERTLRVTGRALGKMTPYNCEALNYLLDLLIEVYKVRV